VSEELNQKKPATTEILEDVVKKTTTDKISVNDLIIAMDSGGFGLIMTIFSLPIIIPLPPPFPSLISIPMVIFSFQMMIGCKSPKLPKRLSNLSVSRNVLAMMIEKSSPYIRKAESFVKPRLSMLSSGWFRQIIGMFCFIFSMSVLLPMPLSNFIPGMGVLIASFGLLGRDGVIILTGLVIGCIGILVTATAVLLGVEAIYMIKDFVLGWFL
jgi:hypothetical protein